MNRMTLPSTQDEWLAVIYRAQRDMPSEPVSYKAPKLGTVEFAKYIDHTLLKLEATEAQISQLCDEAVRHSFKAGLPFSNLFISFCSDVSIRGFSNASVNL